MMIKNFGALIFWLVIFSYRSFIAQTQFDPELLLNPKKNGAVVSAKLKTIEVPVYKDKVEKCIYLKNGFRSSKFLNEKEWLLIKDTVSAYRIDIVYSKYPIRNGVYNEIYPLLFNRLNSLFEMDPGLNDAEIEWNKVLQTDCINDEQVNKLFHGVVIWYRVEPKEEIHEEVLTKTEVIEKEMDKLVSEQNSLEELTESVEKISSLSFVPDSLKKILEKQSLEDQIKTLKGFLEKQIKDQPQTDLTKASDVELKNYNKEVEDFLKKFPAHDTVVKAVFNRHPEWKNALVINDWTGSMYGYGAQILQWHLLNFKKSGIISLTLFNDGDSKNTNDKKVGKTGGIYSEKADNIKKLVQLFSYIMLRGGGGDGPENDIEGILTAMETYTYFSEVILIADNHACVRDIELADRIGKPVKVIICGYDKKVGINPDFVYLAKKTGGGVYTIEDDLENMNVELGKKGEVVSLLDTRFKVTAKKCNDFFFIEREEISDYKYAKRHKKRVRKLSIEKEELDEIPGSVYKMKKLNYLNLSKNNIKTISPKINKLEYLRTLNMSDNKLEELPVEIRNVHFIERIDLSNNSLSKIPSPLLGMKFLITLDLSHNQIASVDKNFNTKKLETLDLSYNSITEVSKVFTHLRNIKILNLSHNLIYDLAENFTGMPTLLELNLSNNRLTKMPSALFKFRRLKTLNLEGNNISETEKNRIINSLPHTKVLF